MIKLTQQQIAVLTSATTQPHGFARRPADMKPAVAAKIAGKLIEHRRVREQHSKGDASVWREDEQGQRFSLKILKAGRVLVAPATGLDTAAASHSKLISDPTSIGQVDMSSGMDAADTGDRGSKHPTRRSLILGLMSREGGATLNELIAATGWLPHTTRAALTGLRKSGFAVERSRGGESGPSVYKVATEPTAEAA